MPRGRPEIVDEGVKFSKENQPSPEAKSAGHRKKKLLKEIAELTVTGTMAELAVKVAERFGLDPEDIDFATLADLRQLEKSLTKGDTRAYNAVMDRLRGKPPQHTDITSGGKPVKIPVIELTPDEEE